MSLKLTNTIEIPHSAASSFDHGAFDAKSRRVFIAHTGRDCIEVIDHDAGTHIATLPGFTEAAGVVGTAREINLFYSELDTDDNVRVIFPNGKLWGEVVKVPSRNSSSSRPA